jgi:hypothetical protein
MVNGRRGVTAGLALGKGYLVPGDPDVRKPIVILNAVLRAGIPWRTAVLAA